MTRLPLSFGHCHYTSHEQIQNTRNLEVLWEMDYILKKRLYGIYRNVVLKAATREA